MTTLKGKLKNALRSTFYDYAPAPVQRAWADRIFSHEVNVVGEAELPCLSDFLSAGDIFVDVGANNGVYSWQAARLGARVHAFEPNPSVLKRLKLLSTKGISIENVALSDTTGTARLNLPLGDAALGTLRTEDVADVKAGFDVRLARLDDFALGRIAFVKIDVEGHEEQVLAGAMETIARDKPILLIEIEELHNHGGLGRITALLSPFGYTGWYLRDGAWRSADEFDLARDQDRAALAQWDDVRGRRALRYYNNFLFLPAGRSLPGAH